MIASSSVMSARSKCVTWGTSVAESVMRSAIVRRRCESGWRSTGPHCSNLGSAGGVMPTGARGFATAGAAGAGRSATGWEGAGCRPPAAAARTSSSVTRPPGPVPPRTVRRSTPSSRASRRVAGVAATGPTWEGVGGVGGDDARDVGDIRLLAREADERHVVRRDAAHGRLEVEESALHDGRGDLGAGPEDSRRLVDDNGAAGLADRGDDRLAVERGDREQVDHLGLDPVLGLEHVGRLPGDPQHSAVRDEREIDSLADDPRAADREGLGILGNLLLRGLVERLRLEKDYRVGVADRAREERTRRPRPRRDHHLEAGHVRVELLLGLRVVLERADATAVGHADHHLAVEASLRSLSVARRMVLDLMEPLEGEAGKLDLADGLEAVERHADRGADDGRLRERAVDHALGAELSLEVIGDAEDATVHADVLAEDQHVGVALHCLQEREVERLDYVELGDGRHVSKLQPGANRGWPASGARGVMYRSSSPAPTVGGLPQAPGASCIEAPARRQPWVACLRRPGRHVSKLQPGANRGWPASDALGVIAA